MKVIDNKTIFNEHKKSMRLYCRFHELKDRLGVVQQEGSS